MEYIVIALVSALAAGLTLFSGFGLGTILLPVFAVFFPVDVAVALTAIVHLLNNVLKVVLLGRHADKSVAWRFGVPAILAAYLGARVLLWFSELEPLARYNIGAQEFAITPVKIVIAVLITFFAIFEITRAFEKHAFDTRFLPVGGILSGFFGGLSGHQGALRSAFLLRCGLSKEGFIGTGVVIACVVDLARLFAYSSRFALELNRENVTLLIVAILAAFLGVFIANRLLKKVTLDTVRLLVSIMLFGIAFGLGAGLI